ncbi:MAG: hypothetical protein AAFX44_06445 [Pseudomonadota bacterium]
MQTATTQTAADSYARCIDISKRVRWDIDRDVIRGRSMNFNQKFLPDSLSLADRLTFLSDDEQRFMSQVQGRTYANLFGLAERFINAKILEVGREHWLGDQTALEALIRFSDEELKHQELFRRIEALTATDMPDGYRETAEPNDVAQVVLSKSTWAVMALTYHIEIFTLVHFKKSIEPESNLSELWKDVFLYHWKEESQHAVIDELEWRREDAKLTAEERDDAVVDLIDLVVAIDGILQNQAAADAEYFLANLGRDLAAADADAVRNTMRDAYRWQFIVSGVKDGQFLGLLTELTNSRQLQQVSDALAPLMDVA